jgi:hypothetical protein
MKSRGIGNEHKRGKRQSSKTCIGKTLLDLSKALRKAEKCRRTLTKAGFSHQRWQEIVNDVEPEFRFMVRPRVLDAIVVYLHSVRGSVPRELLIDHLCSQSVGTIQRLRQSITINLRSGKLIVDRQNKIGLPEWKHNAPRASVLRGSPPIPGGIPRRGAV